MKESPTGELYISIDDDGSIIGLEYADKVLESFSSKRHDSIQPDLFVHTFLEIVEIENKDVVKITVASDGTNYETMSNLQQELTFTDAEATFKEQNLKSIPEQMHTLGLVSDGDYYSNFWLLFSDQC